MESLEDKVLSSGCAPGKQRSENNQCPSLGGRGRERVGNVCKGSLRPGRRGFLLLLFLIITAIKVLSLGDLGRCSQGPAAPRRHICVCRSGSLAGGKEDLPLPRRISLKALSQVASPSCEAVPRRQSASQRGSSRGGDAGRGCIVDPGKRQPGSQRSPKAPGKARGRGRPGHG